MKLNNKTILITGASSGIGAETASIMGGMGNTIILIARRQNELEKVAQEIIQRGGKAVYYPVDLSDAHMAAQVSEKIKNDIGIPDVIINNAGAGKWLSIEETTSEEAQQMMALPYFAAFNITRAFIADMKKRGSGHIVNLTSDASYLPKGNAIAYTSARYALRGFSEALSSDCLDTGVDVSLAVFGKVASSYWQNNPHSEARIPDPTPFMPTLTTSEVGNYLVDSIQKNKSILIKPGVFKILFWAFRKWPRQVAGNMKK
ncbi:MAG: SDR family NAD(P)-dependent oxidoreductase [bacterium]|nr:SDR family NAD(P)-dependent oxidoreductase [bacterium]